MATILVVDDDSAVLTSLCEVLQSAGHTTVEAHEGREALSVLRRQSVDAVLLDVKMPVMDGTEVLAAMPQGPAVIVHSAASDGTIDDLRSRYAERVSAVLPKPTAPPVLLNAVRRCLVA